MQLSGELSPMPYVTKRDMIANALEGLLDIIPDKVKLTKEFAFKLNALKELAIVDPKSQESRQNQGNSLRKTIAQKREAEIFHLEGETYYEQVIGWTALLEKLQIREAYARVLFSNGKGQMVRGVNRETTIITRDSQWARHQAAVAERKKLQGDQPKPNYATGAY